MAEDRPLPPWKLYLALHLLLGGFVFPIVALVERKLRTVAVLQVVASVLAALAFVTLHIFIAPYDAAWGCYARPGTTPLFPPVEMMTETCAQMHRKSTYVSPVAYVFWVVSIALAAAWAAVQVALVLRVRADNRAHAAHPELRRRTKRCRRATCNACTLGRREAPDISHAFYLWLFGGFALGFHCFYARLYKLAVLTIVATMLVAGAAVAVAYVPNTAGHEVAHSIVSSALLGAVVLLVMLNLISHGVMTKALEIAGMDALYAKYNGNPTTDEAIEFFKHVLPPPIHQARFHGGALMQHAIQLHDQARRQRTQPAAPAPAAAYGELSSDSGEDAGL